jgi:hypothetical protein
MGIMFSNCTCSIQCEYFVSDCHLDKVSDPWNVLCHVCVYAHAGARAHTDEHACVYATLSIIPSTLPQNILNSISVSKQCGGTHYRYQLLITYWIQIYKLVPPFRRLSKYTTSLNSESKGYKPLPLQIQQNIILQNLFIFVFQELH